MYNRRMTGPEAIAIIHRLDISQAKFGRLVGLSPTAITKWANGQQPAKPVATMLRLLEARPELVEVLEGLRQEDKAS